MDCGTQGYDIPQPLRCTLYLTQSQFHRLATPSHFHVWPRFIELLSRDDNTLLNQVFELVAGRGISGSPTGGMFASENETENPEKAPVTTKQGFCLNVSCSDEI